MTNSEVVEAEKVFGVLVILAAVLVILAVVLVFSVALSQVGVDCAGT